MVAGAPLHVSIAAARFWDDAEKTAGLAGEEMRVAARGASNRPSVP